MLAAEVEHRLAGAVDDAELVLDLTDVHQLGRLLEALARHLRSRPAIRTYARSGSWRPTTPREWLGQLALPVRQPPGALRFSVKARGTSWTKT